MGFWLMLGSPADLDRFGQKLTVSSLGGDVRQRLAIVGVMLFVVLHRTIFAKATTKDITKHMSPRKQTLCVRKNHESRRESL
jgi:hypothetical protein